MAEQPKGSISVNDTVGLALRHLLTLLSGFLLTKGIAIGDSEIELVTGALTGIGAVVWSLYSKWKKNQKKDQEVHEALHTPVPTPTHPPL